MFKNIFRVLIFTVLVIALFQCQKGDKVETDRVVLKTSMGKIELKLFPEKAPVSVDNFKSYVREGFYDGLIFHRVIAGFMIQGGGLDKEMNKKETKLSIINEADNGLSNLRGTVAYARTQEINSATSQFFINLVDNKRLDFQDSTKAFGYCVFGEVVDGMDVVDKIGMVQTGIIQNRRDVPLKPVIIKSAKIVME